MWVENHIQALYYIRDYRSALDFCNALFADDTKYDNRDIIDLALRAAVKLGDVEAGERIARGCRSKVSMIDLLLDGSIKRD
jgi:hypothetical protein